MLPKERVKGSAREKDKKVELKVQGDNFYAVLRYKNKKLVAFTISYKVKDGNINITEASYMIANTRNAVNGGIERIEYQILNKKEGKCAKNNEGGGNL